MKTLVQRAFHAIGYEIVSLRTLRSMASRLAELEAHVHRVGMQSALPPSPHVEPEFAATGSGTAALECLLRDYAFDTVLDIGAGSQLHARVFADHGKAVTAVDIGRSIYHRHRIEQVRGKITQVIGDFNELTFDGQFDCVWSSHVLEHQVNTDIFLRKIASVLREGGVLAITVPPLKHEIVGGHVSLWNAGLLLYRLVLAGLDCAQARVLAYGYNISVIVQKKTIRDMPQLEFDAGDIRALRGFFPSGIQFNSNERDDPFDGNLRSVNW